MINNNKCTNINILKKILKYYNESIILFKYQSFFASFLETLFNIPASKTKIFFSF